MCIVPRNDKKLKVKILTEDLKVAKEDNKFSKVQPRGVKL